MCGKTTRGKPLRRRKNHREKCALFGKRERIFGCDQICKPGSVFDNHLSVAACCHAAHATYLNLRRASAARTGRTVPCGVAPDWVYMAIQSPGRRWALTPPFHPYRPKPAVSLCCTVPEVAFGGRYPQSCPAEPGLSSCAAFRHLHTRLSDLLASVL